MAVSPGMRLGPYEVLGLIGAGGMCEVYKARDTRLDRTVAIKILPPGAAADADRRIRFEREAKAIAALNHPHICTLHDVGEHASTGPGDPTLYLVMEHLVGETLAERLRKGPLPLDHALEVAVQVAEALAAAHRQGILHRDLKPGNVMLMKSGAKLLDFGLAKLKPSGVVAASITMAALTTQDPATGAGVILGTVPYMSPEQLEGREVDARSDLFSFGALLYEMLTGRRAFEGESQVSIIAAILERDPPPPSSIQPLMPPMLDRIVRQCLAKAQDDRPDTAHDVANDLRWIRETSGIAAAPAIAGRTRGRGWTTLLLAAGLITVGAGVGAGMMAWLRPGAAPPLTARMSLDVRPAESLNAGGISPVSILTPGGSRTAFTWTPDGRALVFAGRRRDGVQQLYVRPLHASEARPLRGTEGAQMPAERAAVGRDRLRWLAVSSCRRPRRLRWGCQRCASAASASNFATMSGAFASR